MIKDLIIPVLALVIVIIVPILLHKLREAREEVEFFRDENERLVLEKYAKNPVKATVPTIMIDEKGNVFAMLKNNEE